jgi:hypothetical protein
MRFKFLDPREMTASKTAAPRGALSLGKAVLCGSERGIRRRMPLSPFCRIACQKTTPKQSIDRSTLAADEVKLRIAHVSGLRQRFLFMNPARKQRHFLITGYRTILSSRLFFRCRGESLFAPTVKSDR